VLGLAASASVVVAIGLIVRLHPPPTRLADPRCRQRPWHRARRRPGPECTVLRRSRRRIPAPPGASRPSTRSGRRGAVAPGKRGEPPQRGCSSKLTRGVWRNESVLSLTQATGSRQPSPGERWGQPEPGSDSARRAQRAIWPSQPSARGCHSGRRDRSCARTRFSRKRQSSPPPPSRSTRIRNHVRAMRQTA